MQVCVTEEAVSGSLHCPFSSQGDPSLDGSCNQSTMSLLCHRVSSRLEMPPPPPLTPWAGVWSASSCSWRGIGSCWILDLFLRLSSTTFSKAHFSLLYLSYFIVDLQPPPTAGRRSGSQGRLTGIFRTAAIWSQMDTGAGPYHCRSLYRSISQSGISFSPQEQDPSTLELLHLWQQFFSDME